MVMRDARQTTRGTVTGRVTAQDAGHWAAPSSSQGGHEFNQGLPPVTDDDSVGWNCPQVCADIGGAKMGTAEIDAGAKGAFAHAAQQCQIVFHIENCLHDYMWLFLPDH